MATAGLIMTAVQEKDFGTIVAVCEITHTQSSVEDAKYNTQLITSWTSRTTHSSTGRMYNVGKLSGIISGVV